MQMQLNAYNAYNNYNNYNTWQPGMGNRTGSRRNSLKNYAAPPPPPMPPMQQNMYNRNMNRTNQQQNMRNSFPPATNPVNELQNLIGRRDDNEVVGCINFVYSNINSVIHSHYSHSSRIYFII